MKSIIIKENELGIEISDTGNIFIQKRKFGSDNDWTIHLSLEELKQIIKAAETN